MKIAFKYALYQIFNNRNILDELISKQSIKIQEAFDNNYTNLDAEEVYGRKNLLRKTIKDLKKGGLL